MRKGYKALLLFMIIALPTTVQANDLTSNTLNTDVKSKINTQQVRIQNNPIISSESSAPYGYIRGSSYWTTSSIREWLNSDLNKVEYTDTPPDRSALGSQAYSDEPGFLSEFTSQEIEGIAVTERRTFVHSNLASTAREGGNANVPRYDGLVPSSLFHITSPDIDKVWKNLYYQTVQEQVFLLAPHELFEYVQKRGTTYKKGLTQDAQSKHNISSKTYQYMVSSYNYSNRNGETLWMLNGEGKAQHLSTSGVAGIVPAMHIKPEYILGNGKRAKELTIGETVEFGKYNGNVIEWKVINKTPEGYPLLWSDKILTVKRYTAPGETRRNSISVNYPSYDISIKNDLKFTNGTSDTTSPYLQVKNEDELFSRQNGKYKLKIQATDKESGIDHIILHDGTKHYGESVEYEVSKNGRYYFTAVDKAGNYYGFEVPVGNINPPADVVIKTSSDGWTNKDVTVDISTTEANTSWEVPSQIGKRSLTTAPEYTSYAGKRYRIRGKVRINKAVDTSYSAVVRMQYSRSVERGNNYTVQRTYPVAVNIPIKNMSKEKYTSFDTIYTVPGNYFGGMYPGLSNTSSGIDSGNYKMEWKDVKIELLDKEDFGVEKITLPNGKEVFSDSYTDVLKEEGTYTYEVLDTRGKTTEKTVEVKIDKTKPTMDITQDITKETNKNIVLSVKANDKGSGVKRILMPNGEWHNGSELTYNVTENGTYSFRVEDNAGNTTTKNIEVGNIDKQAPTFDLTLDTTKPTNGPVVISIGAEDEGSGLKSVKFDNPPKDEVGRNLFLNSTFNRGFEGWRNLPIFTQNSMFLDPEQDKPNSNILSIRRKDNNGTPMHNETKLKVSKGEKYTVSFDVRARNIDKTEYEIFTFRTWNLSNENMSGNGGSTGLTENTVRLSDLKDAGLKENEWITYSHTVEITGDMRLAGGVYFRVGSDYDIREVKLEKGDKATPYSTAYEDDIVKQVVVPENGTYSFTATDKAGNKTTKTIKVDNIVDEEFELEVPTIKPFGDITVKETIEEYSTEIEAPITVTDIWGSDDGWRLDVSATPLSVEKTKGQTESYELPKGSLKISPLEEIKNIKHYEGSKPVKALTEQANLDEGKVTIAKSKNGVGEWDLVFPKEALSILIDPSTARIDNENYPNQPTSYESTLTWDLIQAP